MRVIVYVIIKHWDDMSWVDSVWLNEGSAEVYLHHLGYDHAYCDYRRDGEPGYMSIAESELRIPFDKLPELLAKLLTNQGSE